MFRPKISLATVLLLLFSMIENPELLCLHAHQQHSTEEENKVVASGWIQSLSYAVMHQLKDETETLFYPRKFLPRQGHQITLLSIKLDAFATLLDPTPYDHKRKFKRKLLLICCNSSCSCYLSK